MKIINMHNILASPLLRTLHNSSNLKCFYLLKARLSPISEMDIQSLRRTL